MCPFLPKIPRKFQHDNEFSPCTPLLSSTITGQSTKTEAFFHLLSPFFKTFLTISPVIHLITQCFEVPLRYTIDEKVKGLGFGAYGCVTAAYDTKERQTVAIKKCHNLFDASQPQRSKSTLRELKLLRHFTTKTNAPGGSHPNILNAKDIHIPLGNPNDLTEGYLERRKKFTEVYIVLERYTMSLRQLLDTPTEIDVVRRAYFMAQLLQGLKGIFSAKCIHRDLKPENMLINDQCSLAICDLGSGRGYEEKVDAQITKQFQTTTQWYRPPESFLEDIQSDSENAGETTNQGITNTLAQSADIWSCGVILAEMMSDGKVLLAGKSNDIISQLRTIFTEVAPITESDIQKLECKPAVCEPTPSFVYRFSPLVVETLFFLSRKKAPKKTPSTTACSNPA